MARFQSHDAFAHRIDHLTVMGGHDHGRASAIDAIEQFHDAQRDCRVKVSGRLVAHQQRRAVDHGACHGNALLLAT